MARQDKRFGPQAECDSLEWLAIASEEFVELIQAVVDHRDEGRHSIGEERLQLLAILARWWRAG